MSKSGAQLIAELMEIFAHDEDEAIRLAEQVMLEDLGLRLRGWDVDVDRLGCCAAGINSAGSPGHVSQ